MVQVVGVRFKRVGKVYYFDPGSLSLAVGSKVIVETARGLEYGDVCISPREIDDTEVVQPLKPVVRVGSERDHIQSIENKQREREAFAICLEKIETHALDMNLVDVEQTFDGSKAVFYFTAEGRIDFRELVKDLASSLRSRIEMRQIGVRDEAKLIGGIGPCGRILCCTSFLAEFQPVSIRMAKDQNLSLNPTKISGVCGRLMCCLRYEQDQYEDAKKDPTLAPGYVPPVIYAEPDGALGELDDQATGGLKSSPKKPASSEANLPNPKVSNVPVRPERRMEPRPGVDSKAGTAPLPRTDGEPVQERRHGRKRRRGSGAKPQPDAASPQKPTQDEAGKGDNAVVRPAPAQRQQSGSAGKPEWRKQPESGPVPGPDAGQTGGQEREGQPRRPRRRMRRRGGQKANRPPEAQG